MKLLATLALVCVVVFALIGIVQSIAGLARNAWRSLR